MKWAAFVLVGCCTVAAWEACAIPPEEETVRTDERDGCRREYLEIFSPGMQRAIDVVVVLPPAYAEKEETTFPVLYALHGRGAPFDTWAQMTPLLSALEEMPVVLVSFSGDKASWYLDAPQQPRSRFTSFFFRELVPFVEQRYRVDAERRAITGFSMGGFGALHYMLTQPGFFNSVSGLSPAAADMLQNHARHEDRFGALLGAFRLHPERYARLDPVSRLERAVRGGEELPPLYFAVGLQDSVVLEESRALHAALQRLGVAHTYLETEGGHDWPFWRDASVGVLRFHWQHLSPEQANRQAFP